ncbi:MAG TPA: DUF445 family protein [Arcobacter sp.]|nr:DUF445 family protein [Arcobacter sp.]
MDKTSLTNLVSSIIIVIGYAIGSPIVLMVGLFALSGAITNTLAIHMLFHKIPFIYGSGVIEDRFDVFKDSIKELIMNQFFTKENIEKFIQEENKNNKLEEKLSKVIEKTDFSPAYESLKSAVMESQFGSMLGMFGGEKALEPLKDPFEKKLKNAIGNIVQSESFKTILNESFEENNISESMINHIEVIVQSRLDELTPLHVKEIVQTIIKEHLGWIVLWGGVFGGFVGLVSGVFLS